MADPSPRVIESRRGGGPVRAGASAPPPRESPAGPGAPVVPRTGASRRPGDPALPAGHRHEAGGFVHVKAVAPIRDAIVGGAPRDHGAAAIDQALLVAVGAAFLPALGVSPIHENLDPGAPPKGRGQSSQERGTIGPDDDHPPAPQCLTEPSVGCARREDSSAQVSDRQRGTPSLPDGRLAEFGVASVGTLRLRGPSAGSVPAPSR